MKNLKNFPRLGAFLFASMFFLNTAGAQNSSRFGVKGGLNVSNMFINDVDEKDAKIGLNAGVFIKVALNDRISFQPELLYTMKGTEAQYDNGFVTGSVKYSLDYFEVPLLAVINLTKNVNVHGGVYAASLSRVKVKNVGNISTFDFEKELDKDDFEKLDYGLVAGLGGDFGKINISLRYEYGLKPVGKDRVFQTESRRFPDGRNSVLQFSLGISIL